MLKVIVSPCFSGDEDVVALPVVSLLVKRRKKQVFVPSLTRVTILVRDGNVFEPTVWLAEMAV